MQDAISLIREELGPDASVLTTRPVHSGLLGGYRVRGVEVTASCELEAEPRLTTAFAEEAVRGEAEAKPHPTMTFPPIPTPAIAFDESGADDPHEIPVAGPITLEPGRRKIIALIGPTGVGKTTTIAKLAAEFHLKQNRRVGLITVDTFRIAAVDQLRAYADIIGTPLAVAASPREMTAALSRMKDVDLVLIDTAGRGPHDLLGMQKLSAILQRADIDEVHLALSSVTSPAELPRAIDGFAEFGATHLILTKLDESASLDVTLAALRNCPLPLRYVTTGQRVPNDIEPADAERLMERPVG